MHSITITEARMHLDRLLDEVNESHEPVHIARRRSAGVLIAEDDWRSIVETLHLSSIPGMRKSIIQGMKTPLKECPEDPGWPRKR